MSRFDEIKAAHEKHERWEVSQGRTDKKERRMSHIHRGALIQMLESAIKDRDHYKKLHKELSE